MRLIISSLLFVFAFAYLSEAISLPNWIDYDAQVEGAIQSIPSPSPVPPTPPPPPIQYLYTGGSSSRYVMKYAASDLSLSSSSSDYGGFIYTSVSDATNIPLRSRNTSLPPGRRSILLSRNT